MATLLAAIEGSVEFANPEYLMVVPVAAVLRTHEHIVQSIAIDVTRTKAVGIQTQIVASGFTMNGRHCRVADAKRSAREQV